MSKQTDFIRVIAPLARAEYTNRAKWVLPSVCIAQAALESGWNRDAKTLFGIKGSGQELSTSEYINGKYETVTASFKAYPTIAAAVHGYYDLITGASRYAAAVNNADAHSAAQAIAAAGYATAPNYADTVISIIDKYNLTQYDKKLRATTQQAADTRPTFTYGHDYVVTPAVGLRVRYAPSLTAKIKKAYKCGTVFTCLQTQYTSDGSIWIRTPSGWVCGYDARTKDTYARAK